MPTFNQKVGTACQSIAGLHRYQRAIVAHAQKSGWRRAGKIMRDKIELVIQRVLGDYSNWANRTLTARRGLSRSEEHTSELQSLMRISYAVFCLKNKTHINRE